MYGLSGPPAPPPVVREPRRGTGSATILCHSTAETTAREHQQTSGSVRDFHPVPLTASGTSGRPGENVPSAAPTEHSFGRGHLSLQNTAGGNVRGRHRNPKSATPSAAQVCAPAFFSGDFSLYFKASRILNRSFWWSFESLFHFFSDPCLDPEVYPCFSEAVECTKVTDTEFECGDCPRGMEGNGIECTAVDEVSDLQL